MEISGHDTNGDPVKERLRYAQTTGAPFAPAHDRFGIRLTEVRPGYCAGSMPSDPFLIDPAGTLEVGGLLVLADCLLGFAIGSALGPGHRISTLHIRVSAGCGLAAPGPVEGHARSLHIDEHTGLSSGVITDSAGGEIARISSRCAVLPRAMGQQWVDFTPEGHATDVASALGLAVESVEPSEVTVRAVAAPSLSNNGGQVQGGALGAVAELALARALNQASPSPAASAARDLEVVYLRGVPADGRTVRCRATILHAGRRFGAARAELTDDAGRLMLTATASRYAPAG